MHIDSFWKNRAKETLVVGSLALSLGACGGDDLPRSSSLGINGVRVLALQADRPEVSPGATVQLNAVVSDLELGRVSGASPITVRFEAEHCIDPTVGLSPTPSCEGNPTRVAMTSGTVTLNSPTYTARHTVGSITLPIAPIIFANRSTEEQFNGIPYLVVYRAISGSKTETAFKRLIVSTKPTPNTNPTIIQISGAPNGLPTIATPLTPVVSSPETYQVAKAGGISESRTENLTVSWFINVGSVAFNRTDGASANTWTPPSGAGEGAFLIAVVRDDRGGVGLMNPLAVGP